jgi:hypothetical protein
MANGGQRPTALVTGASGGIGEALAFEIAADGYALVLVARRESELQRVRGVIAGKHNVPVTVVALDLAKPDVCDVLARELEARGVVPDVVVNNAGFGLVGKAAELPLGEQTDCVALNTVALTDLSLRYLPHMKAKGTGGILNVASVAGFMPGPNMAVYFATKNYVLSFTDALSEELKGTGVKVMSLCPGPVPTGFQDRAGMTNMRAIVGNIKPAQQIAKEAWDAFKSGDRILVPGFLNWMSAYALRGAPRRLILPLIGFFMARSGRGKAAP